MLPTTSSSTSETLTPLKDHMTQHAQTAYNNEFIVQNSYGGYFFEKEGEECDTDTRNGIKHKEKTPKRDNEEHPKGCKCRPCIKSTQHKRSSKSETKQTLPKTFSDSVGTPDYIYEMMEELGICRDRLFDPCPFKPKFKPETHWDALT
jgi:hypothetical protein